LRKPAKESRVFGGEVGRWIAVIQKTGTGGEKLILVFDSSDLVLEVRIESLADVD